MKTAGFRVGAVVVSAFVAACGGAPDSADESLGVSEDAIGETGCTTATADKTFTNSATPIYISPQTYSNASCFKAQVVDVNNYSSTFLGAGTAPGGTYVEWADALPTTAAACTSTVVRAFLYVRSGSTWAQTRSAVANGTWSTALSKCRPAVISFLQGDLAASHSYRFAITARDTDASSSGTRKVRIDSRMPAQITEFPVGEQTFPEGIVVGPDNKLWFTVGSEIGNITTAGQVSIFGFNGFNRRIAVGPDNNIWFTNTGNNTLGRITTGGAVLSPIAVGEFPFALAKGPDGNMWLTTASTHVRRFTSAGASLATITTAPNNSGIAAGPDNNMWVGLGINGVDRITTAGAQTAFGLPSSADDPSEITSGPGGQLWYTEPGTNNIGHISPGGGPADLAIPTPSSSPGGITSNLLGTGVWFTESRGNKIGFYNTSTSSFTEYALPTLDASPAGIVVGPDGNVWFTETLAGNVGRLHVGP